LHIFTENLQFLWHPSVLLSVSPFSPELAEILLPLTNFS